MGKHDLNVSFGYSVDVSDAKANLAILKKSLQEIATMKMPNTGTQLSNDLYEAQQAAQSLQKHLNQAINLNTGNLNLNKFQQSLNKSGQSLKSLSTDLLKAGMVGEQAFLSVAKSISNANLNLTKTKGLLASFAETLKNTARWQLSSSMLHGVMGALQSSISYAKDLDESLNDIRIVSGKSADEMVRFAESANKAAKELATTTTRYSEAALIFFQQGLDNTAVEERTRAVIKMANVTKDSEDEVSSYMTAIWNNFAGEKEALEEYADVITALGAATAASSAEIASGLEKFAAIGQEIGLSFDYASTALATVVANTRQSEEVVGTAFKTIFARIQGLSLGETLDDGTNLNKYSEALMKVGINIKDTSGDLKSMDTILNEMGEKWVMLSNDQRVALAQTVGGVRQYNQLIALMDSWQTTFQDNLAVTANSKGALSEQAAIYQESWESASTRVRASLEGIYSDLIPEEVIIDATNGLAKVLNVVDMLIDSFGGLQNIILLVSSIMISKFQANIANAIQSGIMGIQNLGTKLKDTFALMGKQHGSFRTARESGVEEFGKAQESAYNDHGKTQLQRDYSESLNTASNQNITAGFAKELEILKQIDQVQTRLGVNAKLLTGAEREKAEELLKQAQELGKQEASYAEVLDKLRQQSDLLVLMDQREMYNDMTDEGDGHVGITSFTSDAAGEAAYTETKKKLEEIKALHQEIAQLLGGDAQLILDAEVTYDDFATSVRTVISDETSLMTLREHGLDIVKQSNQFEADMIAILNTQYGAEVDTGKAVNERANAMSDLIEEARSQNKLTKEQSTELQKQVEIYKNQGKGVKTGLLRELGKCTRSAEEFAKSVGVSDKHIKKAAESGVSLSNNIRGAKAAAEQTQNAFKQVDDLLITAGERAVSFAGGFATALSGISSVAMGISQIGNAIEQIGSPDTSWTEKLMSGAMAASAVVTMLTQVMGGFQTVLNAVNAAQAVNVAITAAVNAARGTMTADMVKENALNAVRLAYKEAENKKDTKAIALAAAQHMADVQGLSDAQKQSMAYLLLSGAKRKTTEETTKAIAAEGFDSLAKAGGIGPTIGLTIANSGLAGSFIALSAPVLIVVAAIALLVAGFAAFLVISNAVNKAQREHRDKQIEEAAATKKQLDTNKELIDSYSKLKKAYEQQAASKEELEKAALDVADAYESEEMRVLALTGQYDKLTKAIRNTRQAELENAQAQLGLAQDSAEQNFIEDMRDGKGWNGSQEYNVTFNNGTWGKGKDETAIYNAVEKLQKDGQLQYLKDSNGNGDFEIEVDKNNTKEMMAAYEEVLAVVEEAKQSGIDTSESELYKEMTEWLGKSAESYNTLKEAQEAYQDTDIENTILETINATDKEITSLAEYRKLVETTTESLKTNAKMTKEDAEATTKAYMQMDAAYQSFADAVLVSEQLQGIGMTQEAADAFVEGLNGNYSVLAGIDFDHIYSQTQLENEIARLQAEANRETLLLRAQVVSEAAGKVKDGMGILDYRAFQTESGVSWGENGVIEYTEFLQKSVLEQQEYLQNLSERFTWDAIESTQNQVTQYQDKITDLKTRLEELRTLMNQRPQDSGKYIGEFNALTVQLKNNEALLDAIVSENAIGVRSFINEALQGIETVDELDEKWKELKNNQHIQENGGLNNTFYAETLLAIAENYDTCTEAAEAYRKAVAEGNAETIEATEQALKYEMELADLIKQYGLEERTVKTQIKQYKESNRYSKLNEKQISQLVIQNQRLNKGVSSLVKNWEGWNYYLTTSSKNSADWADAAAECTLVIADLVGASEDLELPASFFDSEENLNLITQASEGSTTAIRALSAAVAESIVQSKQFEEGMKNIAGEIINEEQFKTWQQTLSEGIANLQHPLDNLGIGDNVYEKLGGDKWAIALNEMAKTTSMSVDEMNNLLNSMGVDAELSTIEQVQTIKVPQYKTVTTVLSRDPISRMPLETRTATVPDGMTELEGIVPVAQINTGDNIGEKPKVTFTGGGVGGGVSASAIAGNFGSTTSAPKEEEVKDPNRTDRAQSKDPEVERNQKILFTLEKLEKEYDRISQAKERAFGLKKLDLIKSERDAIKNLIDSESAYVETLEEQLKTDAATLAALGIAVDEDGFVADLTKGVDYSAYNAHVDDWNTWDEATQAEKDAEYKGQLNSAGHYASGYLDYFSYLKDDADDAYEKAQDAIEQYRKTQSDLEAAKDEALNYQNAYFDNLLEGTSYTIEIKLDIQDRDMRYLEFLLERIEDTSYNAAKSIAMIGIQGANAFKQINAAKEGLVGILQNHGMDAKSAQSIIDSNNFKALTGMNFTEEEMSTMDTWIESIFEKNSTLLEMREAAWQNVRDEFNEYLEDMDKGIAKIDHLNSITDTYKNIVDILGVGVLGISNELIEDLNKASVKQSTNALKAAQSELEALKEARAKTLAIDTEGWSEDALREHQQTLDEMEESIMAAEEKAMGYWEQALQAATDAWHTSVTHIVDEFEDKIAGAMGSLSELQESFDRASEIDSRYVEEYEKIYELSKLTRQINKDIDASDNLHVKQELRDLAEEIAEIEASGAEMSEYDLENLQRRYELKKAELALEEAQGAKSSVSMVRGSDGSYNYVYTASEEDVAAAEQTYEDKLYAMQQANAEYINNLQSQIIQTQTECAEAIRALQEDTTLSTEEYEAKVAEITQYYEGQLGYYSNELSGVLSNNQTLYETDWQKYSEATGYKIAADKDYVDDFRETNLALVTEYDSLAAYQMSFNSSVETLLVDLSGAYRTWQGDIDTIMQEAGTSLDGFGEHVDDMVNGENGVVAKSDEAAESVESMAERMQEAFDATIEAITSWESEWGNQIDAAIEKNNELIESYNSMKSIMAEGVDNTSASALDALDSGDSGEETNNESDTPETPSTPAPSSATGSGNGTPEVGDKVTYIGGTYYEQSSGKGRTGHRGPGGQVTITKIKANANYPIHVKSSNSAYGWLREDQITGFDTGGYTGNWGDTSGRLALLHQKELVLNASDTANLLSIVDMVREIANIIDLNAAAASGVYSSLTSAGNVMSGGAGTTQHVEIHASFPDAVDHSEIEQAFNNLINTASQYVNRDR